MACFSVKNVNFLSIIFYVYTYKTKTEKFPAILKYSYFNEFVVKLTDDFFPCAKIVTLIDKIGYIGFVPPQIMTWDKANLSGKVTVNDITETARKYVPEMRAKGADVVVVPRR